MFSLVFHWHSSSLKGSHKKWKRNNWNTVCDFFYLQFLCYWLITWYTCICTWYIFICRGFAVRFEEETAEEEDIYKNLEDLAEWVRYVSLLKKLDNVFHPTLRFKVLWAFCLDRRLQAPSSHNVHWFYSIHIKRTGGGRHVGNTHFLKMHCTVVLYLLR